MTRRRKTLQDDEEDAPGAPTSLEMRSPFAPPRVNDETLRATSGYSVAASVQGFRLVSEADGSAVEVTSGVAQIGSDSSNDLVLEHATVSRFHCEVKLEGSRALVRDLGSTNGTLVDSVRVQVGYLRGGSVLQLGQARVRFELLDRRHPVSV